MSSQARLPGNLRREEVDFTGANYSRDLDGVDKKLQAFELDSSKARISRLLLDNSSSYSGFNAFFLSFFGGASSLAKKLIEVKQKDTPDVYLFKRLFQEKIGDKIFRALDDEGGVPTPLTIHLEDIDHVIRFVIHKGERAEKLTRKTVLMNTKPTPLMVCPFREKEIDHPFYKEEISKFVQDFLNHRDVVINLRAQEGIDEQPRAYEYFFNFIRKVGLSIEELGTECELVFLDPYSLNQEDRVPLKSTADFFIGEERIVGANFVVFIRPATWDIESSDPFFPSLSFECSDASSKKNRYLLKGLSFSQDFDGASFCGAVFDRQTLYTWSRRNFQCQLAADLQKELEGIDHLIRRKGDLTDFSYNYSVSLMNYLDFCIYEKQ